MLFSRRHFPMTLLTVLLVFGAVVAADEKGISAGSPIQFTAQMRAWLAD